MKLLFLEWKSLCNEDIIPEFERMGHTVVRLPYDERKPKEEQNARMDMELEKGGFDFLFSFNYFPDVSEYCMEKGIKYVSWVYDSPYINVYSYTVINDCNYIFIFDYAVYEELKNGNINTVYYLPMAVNEKRLSKIQNNEIMRRKHTCDVALVGSLYTEEKHNLYRRFEGMDEFSKGYLDGIVQAQLQVYGYNFIQGLLTSDIVDAMQKVYPTNPNALTATTPEYIYSEYVLNRRVTALERQKVLEMLSQDNLVHVYTHDKQAKIGKTKNLGPVDYYDEMPYVFKNAKINLNITLRSIKTGIPLRAMDIMGCGGFLMTNFQQEFLEYFDEDVDYAFYSDMDELKEKVKYYLVNDEVRKKVALAGCKKVREEHTFEKRIETILSVIQE